MKQALFALCLIALLLLALGCADSDHDSNNGAQPGIFDSDDDDAVEDDDDASGDDDVVIDDDDTDDDDAADDDDAIDDDDAAPMPPRYVRPDLPINCWHNAATHNTYIWKGAQGWIVSRVSSVGPLRAFQLGMVFVEIDVTSSIGDGDFLVNHSDASEGVMLSSVLRNIRFWHDTHPGHQPLVVGFQWGVGSSTQVMNDLFALLDEFLVGPSPLTDIGPLLSRDDWLNDLLTPLGQTTVDEVTDLTPRNQVRLVGFPTIADLQDRITLEFAYSSVDQVQPSFFLNDGSSGHLTNDDEETLTDIDHQTTNRMEQRLTRIYPGGFRILSGNFDIFQSFASGVTNAAMNVVTRVDETDPTIYAFMDEWAPGFAPPGRVNTVDEYPTRLGPPVMVTAIPASDETLVTLEISFDATLGLDTPPFVMLRIAAAGLSGGEVLAASTTDGTLLRSRSGEQAEYVFAFDPNTESTTVTLDLGGDETGYEIFAAAPTVASMTVSPLPQTTGPTIFFSPTFTAVDLTPTGRCSTLTVGGERIFGQWDGEACDASDNPSFVVEGIYDPT